MKYSASSVLGTGTVPVPHSRYLHMVRMLPVLQYIKVGQMAGTVRRYSTYTTHHAVLQSFLCSPLGQIGVVVQRQQLQQKAENISELVKYRYKTFINTVPRYLPTSGYFFKIRNHLSYIDHRVYLENSGSGSRT